MSVSGFETGGTPELTASALRQKLQSLLRQKGRVGQRFTAGEIAEVRTTASRIEPELLPEQVKMALVPADEDAADRSYYVLALADIPSSGQTQVGFSRDYFQPGLGEVRDMVTYLLHEDETANGISGRSYLKIQDPDDRQRYMLRALPEAYDVPFISDMDVFEINRAVDAIAWPSAA